MNTVNLTQLAPNFTKVTIGDADFWFSYETCIAFWIHAAGLVVSENIWSNKIGKHLNKICDKPMRVPHDVFSRKLQQLLEGDLNP